MGLYPLVILAVIASVTSVDVVGKRVMECYSCPGDQPNCKRTCIGAYCYKMVLEFDGESKKTIKQGCFNNTDVLSKVDECNTRTSAIGTRPNGAKETMCICTKERCNSSPHSSWTILPLVCASIVFLLSR